MALAKLKGNDYLRFLFFIFFNKICFYLCIILHLSMWEKETSEIPPPCQRIKENSRTFFVSKRPCLLLYWVSREDWIACPEETHGCLPKVNCTFVTSSDFGPLFNRVHMIIQKQVQLREPHDLHFRRIWLFIPVSKWASLYN